MALDLRQNFVSAQYFDNKLIQFNHFYNCIHIDNRLRLLRIVFRTFVPELLPLNYARISFLLNIMRINQIV